MAGYLARYELPVRRRVRVRSVGHVDSDPKGRLVAQSDAGAWAARVVVSATGTFSRPFVPTYPGAGDFAVGGRLHAGRRHDRLVHGIPPALSHLARLGLRGRDGSIATIGTRARAEPRLHLLGYGDWTGPASATLIGVGRPGAICSPTRRACGCMTTGWSGPARLGRMDSRVDFITIATPDLDAARRFYVTGLGWTPTLDVPGEILFFQVGHGTMLGLYDAAAFRADLGLPADAGLSNSGTVLSHNVANPAAVDRIVDAAASTGATVVKPPQRAAFGGYHGHVADPNGVIWEIAHNPGWGVDPDGTVRLDADAPPA